MIPMERLQELRGKSDHWSVRNQSQATETPYIGRLLRSKSDVFPPKGSLREVKQIYLGFWYSLEYIRVQMSAGDYCSQSYVGAFSRVLSIGGILSPPLFRGKVACLGSDSAMYQCAAVDYSAGRESVFSYSFALDYLSELTGLPRDDFFPISLSEFLGFLCFLTVRASEYTEKLIAYAGDNQNVAQWIKFRRRKNRIAQYFCRISNRLEVEYSFAVFSCYISSSRNAVGDKSSRISMPECSEYARSQGLELVDALTTPRWFLAERRWRRPLVLSCDSPDRVRLIMQFSEKRIIRHISPPISDSAHLPFVGLAADAWVLCEQAANSQGLLTARFAWPSERALMPTLEKDFPQLEGGPATLWALTYPPEISDIEALAGELFARPLRESYLIYTPSGALAGYP